MKTPSEEKFYEIDFRNQPAIKAGAVISSEVLTVEPPGELDVDDDISHSGGKVIFLAKDGDLWTLYRVNCKATLNTGEILEDEVTLRIVSESLEAVPEGSFSAQHLLTTAYLRFGPKVLQSRVSPTGSQTDKELELLKIAQSVISRVQGAAEQADSWPLPGAWPEGSVSPIDGHTDIAGEPFTDIWPADLLQRALELFDYRTYAGLEAVPATKSSIGKGAEKYFFDIARGVEALTVGGAGEPTSGTPLSSRDRAGNDLLGDGAQNRKPLLDTFHGGGWDYS